MLSQHFRQGKLTVMTCRRFQLNKGVVAVEQLPQRRSAVAVHNRRKGLGKKVEMIFRVHNLLAASL